MNAQADTLSQIFSALGDPTRRAILQMLAGGPLSVNEIAQPFNMTGPAVTKHLKVLENAGLVRQDRQAQFRPRTLEAAPLHEAQEWIEQYRKFWEQSFNRLDEYLVDLQSQAKDKKDKNENNNSSIGE